MYFFASDGVRVGCGSSESQKNMWACKSVLEK